MLIKINILLSHVQLQLFFDGFPEVQSLFSSLDITLASLPHTPGLRQYLLQCFQSAGIGREEDPMSIIIIIPYSWSQGRRVIIETTLSQQVHSLKEDPIAIYGTL